LRKKPPRPWWVSRGVYGVLRDGVVTLWRLSWGGIPISVCNFPAGACSGRELLNICERKAEQMLSKQPGRRVAGGVGECVSDPEWSVLYPTLFDHLTQTVWADGSARQTSSLSLFTDGSCVKCVLKDREAGLCLWAASKSFQELFGVLEALLVDPAAEWRVDRQTVGQKATRVKK